MQKITRILRKGVCSLVSASMMLMPGWAMGGETNMSAIGREADLGTLEAGKLADITTINMTSPHLMPRLMPIHQLMLYGNTGDVADVFVAGKALMLDRRVLTVSEADVFECAQTASLEAIHRAGYERLLTPADNFWTGAQSNLSALREP